MSRPDLTLTYWMRRPFKHDIIDTTDINDVRSSVFDDEKELFKKEIDDFNRELDNVNSTDELEELFLRFNIDYRDVIRDVSAFKSLINANDIETAILRIKSDIRSWVDDSISDSRDTNDFFSLKGHPNVRVMGGGPSLKRSMGY